MEEVVQRKRRGSKSEGKRSVEGEVRARPRRRDLEEGENYVVVVKPFHHRAERLRHGGGGVGVDDGDAD